MGQLNFTKEEIDEFTTEVEEMLTQAEESFLSLDKGTEFKSCYQNIFRVFHSIKGGSGMFGLMNIHHHMHEVENLFQQFKNEAQMSSDHVTFFLSAIDACRKMIKGENIAFTYSLPSPDKKTAPTATTKLAPTPTAAVKEVHGKLFLIDDQPDILEIMQSHLEDQFQIFTYTDPRLAIAEVSKHKPDAIFTDFNMPEMNGIDVLNEMSKYDADLPVILVSGVLTKEIILQALGCGIHAAIEKNFTEAQLFMIAEEAVSRYRLYKLLNKSINLILYQFPELSNYLKIKGQNEVLKVIETNLNELIDAKRRLKKTKPGPHAA